MPPHRRKKDSQAKETAKEQANQIYEVIVLRIAMDEGRKCLTDIEYAHMVAIEKRLAHFGNRQETADLRIEPIGTLFELKEKGGPLNRKNIRVFFAILSDPREVVILKTYKKEKDDQTPRYVVIAAEDRLEDYLQHGRSREGCAVHAEKKTHGHNPT